MPPRAARWIREQVCFLSVLAVMAAGFGYLLYGHGHWLRSTAVMGVSLVLAAVLRATVPPARVGLLQVRARWIDTVLYLALGVLVLVMDLRLHR